MGNIISPLTWILQVYQMAMGLVIVIIDGPTEKLPQFIREQALSGVACLHNNVTRVLFYLFIACQQGSQSGFLNMVVGWYFAFIAVGFTLVSSTDGTQPGVEGSSAQDPQAYQQA